MAFVNVVDKSVAKAWASWSAGGIVQAHIQQESVWKESEGLGCQPELVMDVL